MFSRARRASSGDDPEALDLGATYTFSFHTSFVSLSRWRVTGLPLGLPELDLRSFWADGDLRLVLYEASDDPVAPHARACSNLASLMSTAMMREAPASFAASMTARPTAPSPNTATEDSFSTLAVLNTAPQPAVRSSAARGGGGGASPCGR